MAGGPAGGPRAGSADAARRPWGRPTLCAAWLAGLLIGQALTLPVAAAEPTAAPRELGQALLTGTGVLTKCRSWMLFRTCDTYGDVPLPKEAAVGGWLPISYGSNIKHYTFPVLRILKEGARCTIYGEQGDDEAKLDHIVAPCRTLPTPG